MNIFANPRAAQALIDLAEAGDKGLWPKQAAELQDKAYDWRHNGSVRIAWSRIMTMLDKAGYARASTLRGRRIITEAGKTAAIGAQAIRAAHNQAMSSQTDTGAA